MENPIISIIVPVYNVEKYIERCLNSIIKQTYKKKQIIVVNDLSPDKSDIIIQHLVNKDNRIIYVKRESNGGLSAARNSGLDYVAGDYVMFVDGDDWIDLDCIEKLIANIKLDTDVVLFPYIKEFNNYSEVAYLTKFSQQTTFTADCIYKKLIGPICKSDMSPAMMDRYNTAWGKLYKTTAISNYRFEDTKIVGIEDGWFNIQVFSNLKGSVCLNNKTYYHYEKSNAYSLLHSLKSDFADKRWNFYRKLINFLKTRNEYDIYIQRLSNRIIIELFGILVNICRGSFSCNKKNSILKCVLNKYEYNYWFKTFEFSKTSFFWSLFYRLIKNKVTMPLVIAVNIWLKLKK